MRASKTVSRKVATLAQLHDRTNCVSSIAILQARRICLYTFGSMKASQPKHFVSGVSWSKVYLLNDLLAHDVKIFKKSSSWRKTYSGPLVGLISIKHGALSDCQGLTRQRTERRGLTAPRESSGHAILQRRYLFNVGR